MVAGSDIRQSAQLPRLKRRTSRALAHRHTHKQNSAVGPPARSSQEEACQEAAVEARTPWPLVTASKIQHALSFTSVLSRCNVATHSGWPATFHHRGRPACAQALQSVRDWREWCHDSVLYVAPQTSQRTSLSTLQFLLQQPNQYLRPRVEVGRNSRLLHVPSPEALDGTVLTGGGKTADTKLQATEKCNRISFHCTESRSHWGKHCISRRAHSRRGEAGLKPINLTGCCTNCCATDVWNVLFC